MYSRDNNLPNIQPVEAGDWIRMFLYAYPGWGKTSLIATGAEKHKTLIIRSSMDQIPARALKSGAQQVICDTHEEMLQVLEFLRYSEHDYEWVWWDCVSIAQDVLLDDVWEASWHNNPKRNWVLDKDTGLPTTKPNISPTGGKDKPEYGMNADRIAQWVRFMVGCKRFHFGMTAHPMEGPHPTNDEGGDVLRPWVQVRQMPEKLCGYCNMVAFLEVTEPDDENDPAPRVLRFKETPRYYAKDLYDAFLPSGDLADPTIPKVMTAVAAARASRGLKPPQRGIMPQRGAVTTGRGRGSRGTAAPTAAPRGRGRRA